MMETLALNSDSLLKPFATKASQDTPEWVKYLKT